MFKVKYQYRNRLAQLLKREIKSLGLIDTWAMYESIRISATMEALGTLDITINAMYYYKYLDSMSGVYTGIPRTRAGYDITEDWMAKPEFKAIVQEIYKDYVEWLTKKYSILQMAKLMSKPQITINVQDIGAG
jgi:hypothetical protein